MKTFLTTAIAAIVGVIGGFAGRDYSNVGPLIDPPKATAIVVRGPQEGVIGSESFFVATLQGDHGRPTWIVSPECELSANDDGTIARLLCRDPGLYTITVTVGGKDASVAATMTHFEAIDLDQEIQSAVAQATMTSEPQGPTLSQLIASLPNFPQDHQDRMTAAGVFRLMSQRLQAGLVPSDSDPLRLIQGQLGEGFRDFLDDVSDVVNQLRATGEVTTAASFAPLLEEIATTLAE